ncbi:MAG: two-component regulator propeller domain-containing protein [Sphingobacteriales bacterium]
MGFARLSICWLFICITGWSFGQEKQYHFLHLDIKNGLSDNQVSAIYKDKKGFMWFGTQEGLNKYDGYTVKVFRHDANNPTSLSDDGITNIQEGPCGKLWIYTHSVCNIYDPVTEQFERNISRVLKQMGLPFTPYPDAIKKDHNGNYWFLFNRHEIYVCDTSGHRIRSIQYHNTPLFLNDNIADIEPDHQGFMWIAFETGILQKININTGKVVTTSRLLSTFTNNAKSLYRFIADRQGSLWIYEPGGGTGIYYLDPLNNKFQHFDNRSAIARLNYNVVNNIAEDNKGNMWVATDHGGINLIDRNTFSVRYIVNQEDDPMSISENSGILYIDNQGIVWFGTYKRGIDYYQENIIKFPIFRHYASVPGSLNYNDVDHFAEDGAGNLWIGTNGGGLFYFDRATGKFKQYKHEENNANSLSNNVVISLCIDHEKKLWIGTYFGGLDCFDGSKFIHYRHNPKNNTTIADDRIWSILEDSSDRVWIGTFSAGLDRFDRETQTFIHYQPFQPNSVRSGLISNIFEDKDQDLWFGGYFGLDVLIKKTGQFIHYIHDSANANSIVSNYVKSIIRDRHGLMWIGTINGLDILDTETGKFYHISKEDGLPGNVVIGILEDNFGNMWVSTSKGLSNIVLKPGKKQPYTYQFHNFDESDGLQGGEFNPNSCFKTRKGELIFGGAAGFNLFDPAKISYNENRPVLAFTDLLMFNKPLSPADDINGHIILSKSISATDTISLKYDENALSIRFADLNYLNHGKTVLQYKLDGFDKVWFNDLKARKATYTNLDPGNYTFKVRAINSAGKPFDKSLTLVIKITPPFWKTPLAYMLYLSLILGAILYARHWGIKKIENKFALEQERQEARRMHEVDTMKINFFTNISHEFRTPLSLILAPVEKMLKSADDRDSHRKLTLVHQNAKRLLNMINQLLDLSRISAHKLDLNLKEDDIIKSIKESCEQFLDLAEKKHIRFTFRYAGDAVIVQFDSEKIERILFNLLSNAIKFTPENGLVGVDVALISAKESEMSILEIKLMTQG